MIKNGLVSLAFGGIFISGGCGNGIVNYDTKEIMCRDGTIYGNYVMNDDLKMDTLSLNKDVFKDYFSDFYLESMYN